MSLFSCAPPSCIAVSSLISHSRHHPGFATAALQSHAVTVPLCGRISSVAHRHHPALQSRPISRTPATVPFCGRIPSVAHRHHPALQSRPISRTPPPSRFAAASLQFNGGSKNTRNCDLKCPCGHSRQQKAARMTPRMSSLRPCCLVPQTGRQWPWRISTSLSAVSKKEPPKKGWSAHALSFDLPVFTCHGYCVSRAGGGKGQPEGNGSWVAGKVLPMEGGGRRAAGLCSK